MQIQRSLGAMLAASDSRPSKGCEQSNWDTDGLRSSVSVSGRDQHESSPRSAHPRLSPVSAIGSSPPANGCVGLEDRLWDVAMKNRDSNGNTMPGLRSLAFADARRVGQRDEPQRGFSGRVGEGERMSPVSGLCRMPRFVGGDTISSSGGCASVSSRPAINGGSGGGYARQDDSAGISVIPSCDSRRNGCLSRADLRELLGSLLQPVALELVALRAAIGSGPVNVDPKGSPSRRRRHGTLPVGCEDFAGAKQDVISSNVRDAGNALTQIDVDRNLAGEQHESCISAEVSPKGNVSCTELEGCAMAMAVLAAKVTSTQTISRCESFISTASVENQLPGSNFEKSTDLAHLVAAGPSNWSAELLIPESGYRNGQDNRKIRKSIIGDGTCLSTAAEPGTEEADSSAEEQEAVVFSVRSAAATVHCEDLITPQKS